MKTILLFVLCIFLCSNGTKAQAVESRTRNNSFHKSADFSHVKGLRALHGFNTQNKFREKVSGASPGVAGQSRSFAKVNQNKSSLTDQRPDSMIYELWEPTTNQWVFNSKTWYIYSVDGDTISEYTSEWDESSSQWIPAYIYESVLDDFGDITSNVYYIEDESTNQWVAAFQTRNVITRDANDSIILNIAQEWDEPNNQWVNSEKFEYTNDESGNKTLLMYYEWDGTESKWKNTYKGNLTYDENGRNDSIVAFQWDEAGSQWLYSDKAEYTYDTHSTLIVYTEWDDTGNQWVSSFKEQYTYDEKGNKLSYSSHDWSGSQWDAYDRETYFYSEQEPSAIPDHSASQITVYPNPATDYVVFDMEKISGSATVELFNIEGKKVLEQKLSINKQVSVSGLSTGLYMYKVNNNGSRYTGKFLLK